MQVEVATVLQAPGVTYFQSGGSEIYDTLAANTEAQRIHAEIIQRFCELRTDLPTTVFQINLVRATEGVKAMAHFGQVLSVDNEHVSLDAIAELQADIAHLAPMLATGIFQITVDFANDERGAEFLKVLEADITSMLLEMRELYGGRRIPKPIDIWVGADKVATLSGAVPSRPDKPAQDVPGSFFAQIESLTFKPQLRVCLSLVERPEGAPKAVVGYVTERELALTLFQAGITGEIAEIKARSLPDAHGKMITEILEVNAVVRDVLPLA